MPIMVPAATGEYPLLVHTSYPLNFDRPLLSRSQWWAWVYWYLRNPTRNDRGKRLHWSMQFIALRIYLFRLVMVGIFTRPNIQIPSLLFRTSLSFSLSPSIYIERERKKNQDTSSDANSTSFDRKFTRLVSCRILSFTSISFRDPMIRTSYHITSYPSALALT